MSVCHLIKLHLKIGSISSKNCINGIKKCKKTFQTHASIIQREGEINEGSRHFPHATAQITTYSRRFFDYYLKGYA